MGQFRFELTAVGGHGCQREVKDGGKVYGCGNQSCPDCALASLLIEFDRVTGSNLESATLKHWPGQTNEVVDEFVVKDPEGRPLGVFPRAIRIRHGSF